MAAVCPDLPVHQALQANLVAQANPVLLVFQATLANHQFNLANPLLHHHASHAHKVLRDRQAHLVPLVTLAHLANLETQERMLLPANPDLKAHLDHLASLVLLALLASPALLLNRSL